MYVHSASLRTIISALMLYHCSYLFASHMNNSTAVKIDEIVQAEVQYDLFSGTVLVAEQGEIIYAEALGEANKESHAPNTLETRFNIGSVQKPFIAILIMQLSQEGKLDLNDPLSKFFPDCPFPTASKIRIKHLLNHTSGLGDYRRHENYQVQADSFLNIEDVLPLVYAQPPAIKPGKEWKYSNTGYLFLKAIIENVTGMKLKNVLEQRILHPLGMDQTALFSGGDTLSFRAAGYKLAEDGWTYERVLEEPSAYAGGGIYTTVMDLFKLDQALYTEELLNENAKKIMFSPVKPSSYYGYGWIVVSFAHTPVIYHGGRSGGFNSEFRRYPEKGYTIIVLSNYPDAAYELANKIDCMLLELPYAVATETESHCRRGTLLGEMEMYESAYKFYMTVLDQSKLAATESNILERIERGISRLGYGYLERKDYEKAINTFNTNIVHFPNSFHGYHSLAETYLEKGERELAILNFEKAIELNPRETKRQKETYKEGRKSLKVLKSQ